MRAPSGTVLLFICVHLPGPCTFRRAPSGTVLLFICLIKQIQTIFSGPSPLRPSGIQYLPVNRPLQIFFAAKYSPSHLRSQLLLLLLPVGEDIVSVGPLPLGSIRTEPVINSMPVGDTVVFSLGVNPVAGPRIVPEMIHQTRP